MQPDREELVNKLYWQYAVGGGILARWRQNLLFWRKILLWRLVINSSLTLKRSIDIVGSVMGLFFLSPVFLVTSLAIKLDDQGQVFFRQERVGKWGMPFTMYKFRSMVPNAEQMKDSLLSQNESQGIRFKMKQDPRITKVGRALRKLSIDELPQLWNVLKGDMSLVGPRPSVPKEVREYSLQDRRRLGAKPGITCFWQVSGRSELSFDQQVSLDIEYIQSQSLKLDILIVIKTIPAILLGKGAY
jgi:exopolysaccharide biosynthesis polyprenyl glycosylphosphotransferase